MTCTGERSSAGSAVRLTEPVRYCNRERPSGYTRLHSRMETHARFLISPYTIIRQRIWTRSLIHLFIIAGRGSGNMHVLISAGLRGEQETPITDLVFPGWTRTIREPDRLGEIHYQGKTRKKHRERGRRDPPGFRACTSFRRVSYRGRVCVVSPRDWCRPQ
jgi:hypothetical protein